ncbi:MAG: rRNA pseudouridine synthase [Mollicutes bacterium]|jgi:23S rRNA pseudouridine2605 synthase|nr:rRNA pseudouridine synthase [Mollicutes bacterium]
MERLQKFIASSGICSRRKAEELITSGKVKVNGIVVTELGTKVSFEDTVLVNNKKIVYEKKVYYMLNKPRGYISSVSDDKGRKTVIDLIHDKRRIFPIGRLDYDTTGLLLLTNDGEFANLMMHPKNEVPKTYAAKIEGKMSMDTLFSLRKGVLVEDIKIIPKQVKIKSYDKKTDTSIVKITLIEGQNHIVKKIFASVNHPVIKLKREEYGNLTLGKLRSAEYRELTEAEILDLTKKKS